MKASRFASTGVVLAVVAIMLVTGVIVAGAHGGGPKRKVIHACVDDQTGAIQIVGGNDHCGAGESPLDWNGKGPKGPQGPPGPAGETGLSAITVVTATTLESINRGPAPSNGGLGVGVDCPGDARATGGGGRSTGGGTTTGETSIVSGFSQPLVATYPLEKNSTTDAAEIGDKATGWYAMAAGLRPNAPEQLEPGQALTVYAVCVHDGQGPPEED